MRRRELRPVLTFTLVAGVLCTTHVAAALAGNPRTPRRRAGVTAEKAVNRDTRSHDGAEAEPGRKDEPTTIDVLSGLRDGRLAAEAEGTGDGRITIAITNRSSRPLRVVLPPGLIASGASGQFG